MLSVQDLLYTRLIVYSFRESVSGMNQRQRVFNCNKPNETSDSLFVIATCPRFSFLVSSALIKSAEAGKKRRKRERKLKHNNNEGFLRSNSVTINKP